MRMLSLKDTITILVDKNYYVVFSKFCYRTDDIMHFSNFGTEVPCLLY